MKAMCWVCGRWSACEIERINRWSVRFYCGLPGCGHSWEEPIK